MMVRRAYVALSVLAFVLCAHFNTAEGGLELTAQSEQEFADIMNDLKRNAFIDATADADLSHSLRENLRGPQGKPGPTGARGLTGPQGPPGAIGPRGKQGVQGPRGLPGPRGPQGERGLRGAKGPAGAEGPIGMPGPRGSPGATGQKGDQGPEGPQGPIGPPGERGFTGPQGKPGPSGYQGKRGQQGFPGKPGPPGVGGKVGPMGPQGRPGEPGPQGKSGKPGPHGFPGPKGPPGAFGEAGPPGRTGPPGKQGERGPHGMQGPQGPRGATGPAGQPGEAGPRGVKGDQGPKGPPGSTGAMGPQGERGARGMPGPPGSAGPPGEVGNAGKPGEQGPRGADGRAGPRGPPGPKGRDGSLRKYTLTGSRRFMLEGGENANVNAKIYSGQEKNAPILFFETEKTPVSISMYQTAQRQKVASINGFYGNVGIGETKPQTKLQVKGQILLSHNFNNVVSAKEKRRVGDKEESVEFDLIGTYWGMDKKAVYLGAYTGEKKPGHFAEKIVFGGSTNEPQGKGHVDLTDGKIYASGFVTTNTLRESEEDDTMSDLEAESLIQVSAGEEETAREIDLGRSTRYLHRKVRDQAATIKKLQEELLTLRNHFKDIQNLMN